MFGVAQLEDEPQPLLHRLLLQAVARHHEVAEVDRAAALPVVEREDLVEDDVETLLRQDPGEGPPHLLAVHQSARVLLIPALDIMLQPTSTHLAKLSELPLKLFYCHFSPSCARSAASLH